jgi:hypothetical protein
MAQIPVGPTIGAAYSFLFGQIGTILAHAGLPAILYAGADYLSRSYTAAHPAQPGADEFLAGGPALLVMASAELVKLFALSVAAAAIARVVLGLRNGDPVYFALDRTAWRMFLANLRFVLGATVLILLAAGVSLAAYSLAGIPIAQEVEVQPTMAVVLAAFVSYAVFLSAFVSILQLGFLLPAVVANEARGGLKRSYLLARGNAWRLLAIALALGLPVLLLVFAAAAMVLSSALGPDFGTAAVTPELMRRAEDAIAQRLLPWEILNAVIFVLFSGLVYSGSAYAYLAAAGKADRA